MDYYRPTGSFQRGDLHPTIEEDIATSMSNMEAGYETPTPPDPKPIMGIDPIFAFDYDKGLDLAGGDPTVLLNSMKADPDFKNFDVDTARKTMTDPEIVEALKKDSSKKKREMDISMSNAAGLDTDFKKGMARAATGIRVVAEELKGPWADEKAIEGLQSFASSLENAREDEDFFSAFTGGDMLVNVAAFPIAAQSRIGSFVLNGILGYANARATEDRGTATAVGLGSGAVGAGVSHALRYFDGRAIGEAVDKAEERFLTTPEKRKAFEEYYDEWQKVVRVDPKNVWKGNYPATNRGAALADFIEEGGSMKGEAITKSWDVEHTLRNIGQQRRQPINEILKTVDEGDIPAIGKAIQKGIDTVKYNYNQVMDSLGLTPVNNSDILANSPNFTDDALDMLDDVAKSDMKWLRELVQDDNVPSLVKAKQHINALLRSTSAKKLNKKFNLTGMKDGIDRKLKDVLPPNKYAELKAADADYALMANVRSSKLGELIDKFNKKEITVEQTLRDLHKISGDQLFKDIETLIGTKGAEKLELATIKEAFKGSGSTNWSTLLKQVDNKGFVTPEGKNLQKLISKFSELFDVDNIVVSNMGTDMLSGGAKTDAHNQAVGTLFNWVTNTIQKLNPASTVGKRARSVHTFVEVLKHPQQMIKFEEKMSRLSPAIVKRQAINIIQQLPRTPSTPPAMHYNPKPGINPKPSNPVFQKMVQGQAIKDGLEEAYKDAMFSKLAQASKNDITDIAFKHFDGTRFPDKMAKLAKAMKEGKDAYNLKLLQAGIKGEAELMARAIEKEHGVKVDKKMMESLIKYVTKNAMKDCE